MMATLRRLMRKKLPCERVKGRPHNGFMEIWQGACSYADAAASVFCPSGQMRYFEISNAVSGSNSGKIRRISLGAMATQPSVRSEEHTSELQSLMRNSYAVFCL